MAKLPHLPTLAVDLRRLADIIDTDKAPAAINILLEQSQPGYPTTASGTPNTHTTTDEPWTATERAALHQDKQARRAAANLSRLTNLAAALPTITTAIEEALQDRPIDLCQHCGNALPPGGRCQRLLDPDETGHRQLCEGSGAKKAARSCLNCGTIMQTGQYLRAGRCNACNVIWRRTGRERVTTDLDLDRVIIEDPAA